MYWLIDVWDLDLNPPHLLPLPNSYLKSLKPVWLYLGLPHGAVVKNPPTDTQDARDGSTIPGSGRSRGEGHGNPFQYSCLDNPTDR